MSNVVEIYMDPIRRAIREGHLERFKIKAFEHGHEVYYEVSLIKKYGIAMYRLEPIISYRNIGYNYMGNRREHTIIFVEKYIRTKMWEML